MFGVAATAAALTLLPASRLRADIGGEFGPWWKRIRGRRGLPDFLRMLASSIESDSSAEFEKYARANPDFPVSPEVQKKGKPPWGRLGRLLEWLGKEMQTW